MTELLVYLLKPAHLIYRSVAPDHLAALPRWLAFVGLLLLRLGWVLCKLLPPRLHARRQTTVLVRWQHVRPQ